MSTTHEERQAHDLCNRLLNAESEKEIIRILTKAGYWENSSAWREFGDNENNFSIIGNQQSSPVAAMVEKFVNSIDAVLMRECYLEGVNPQGPKAPKSVADALERYFGVKDGNLANTGQSQREELANNIGFVASGRKNTPNYTVFDWGEGQTPETMPHTLLSLSKSNKLRIPFVQGKFNMGGTGVLQFCGERNLQLVISRRHPQLAPPDDPSSEYWGFTIVRREDPERGRRSSMFTYLAPRKKVLRFRAPWIQLPNNGNPEINLPALEWGTIIKMFEYEMTGLKRHIRIDFNYKASLLLAKPGLPIRFYETREYEDPTRETIMVGLRVRLDEDKRDKLEEGFPTYTDFKLHGETLRASVYAFRRGSAETYRPDQEGIIFTINGQTHGVIKQGFFNRCGMSYLADSLLVIVECDNLTGRAREDLFMNSRDRLRSGELRSQIEKILEEIIKDHPGLRELRERRRREEVENRLADAQPLKDILNNIISKSKTLTSLFVEGTELSNPFKMRPAGTQDEFVGRRHPTYFLLKKGDAVKNCYINLRFRVQFLTDADNDYFGRDNYPGRFTLYLNGIQAEDDDYVLNLWNGTATLTVTLPVNASVDDVLEYRAEVYDETLLEPFVNTFTVHVVKPLNLHPSSGGKRSHPTGGTNGDRLLPSGLAMPNIIPVRQEEWSLHGFDKFSALKVMENEGIYEFFVNLDNIYLQSEIKSLPRDGNAALLEARFQYGLVLIGLSLIREDKQRRSRHRDDEDDLVSVDEQIANVSKSIAPVLLPMINELGGLEISENTSLTAELE